MIAAVVAIQVFGLPDFGQRIGIPVRDVNALDITGQADAARGWRAATRCSTVRGEITNQTDEVQRVPQIRAELRDAQERVVYSWSIAPPVRELAPRGRAVFDSAERDVPRGGRNLTPELRADFLSTQASRPNCRTAQTSMPAPAA